MSGMGAIVVPGVDVYSRDHVNGLFGECSDTERAVIKKAIAIFYKGTPHPNVHTRITHSDLHDLLAFVVRQVENEDDRKTPIYGLVTSITSDGQPHVRFENDRRLPMGTLLRVVRREDNEHRAKRLNDGAHEIIRDEYHRR